MAKGFLNKATLVGNLGNDADLRFTPSGTPVAPCSLATTESWIDKAGKARERPEWHRLVMWRQVAHTAKRDLKKGSKVYVEGKLNTRSWHDARGRRSSVTEIVVSNLKLLGTGRADLDGPFDEIEQLGDPLAPAPRLELSLQPSL